MLCFIGIIFYNSINRVKINYLRMLLSQASALDLLIKGLRKGDICEGLKNSFFWLKIQLANNNKWPEKEFYETGCIGFN